MITADAAYTLRTGTKTQIESSANIYVSVRVDGKDRIATINAYAVYNGQVVDGQIFQAAELRFDGIPASGGSKEFAWFINVAEQIVAEELGLMSENSGVTFTAS